MTIVERTGLLLNRAQLKLVKVNTDSLDARDAGLEEHDLFCATIRLYSVILALQHPLPLSWLALDQLEIIINSTGGYSQTDYASMDFSFLDETRPPNHALSACNIYYKNDSLPTEHDSVCETLDALIERLSELETNAASIAVVAAENNPIVVTESVLDGVKTFTIAYAPYTAPTIDVAAQGSKLFEVGHLIGSLTVNIMTVKGKNAISSKLLTAPSAMALTNLEGLDQLVYTNVIAPLNFAASASDGTTTVNDTDAVSFVYPSLWGVADAIPNLAADKYALFNPQNKFLGIKLTPTFSGNNKFLVLLVPGAWSIVSAKDPNLFQSTIWEALATTVSSTIWGARNWSNVAYTMIKSKVKTDGNGTYTFVLAPV